MNYLKTKLARKINGSVRLIYPASMAELIIYDGNLSVADVCESLIDAVDDLQTRTSDAENNISTLTSNMSTAQSDIVTLKGDVSTAKTDITNLKSSVSTNTSDISSLKTRTTTAEGNITTLQDDLDAVKTTADSAIQSVKTGTANGTISVDGTNISVYGLGSATYKTAGSASGNVPVNGSALGTTANVPVVTNTSGQLVPHASGALGTAAFKASTAFDSAGAASTVQTNLDNYKTSNDSALAAVKTTADGAVQSVTTGTSNGTLAVDGTNVSVKGLASAAYKTAGTASGNVPVNGSALGTTANVPVVTNASGQLIPHASGALGTAAFSNSTDFDASGAASTVQSALNSYKTSNDAAVAAIKTTADGAVQSVATGSTNGTLAVDGTDVSVKGLGSAAYKTAGSASGNVPVTGAALGTTANVPVVTNASGALIPHASGVLGTAAFKAATAFDTSGAASTVQSNLDAYETSNDAALAAVKTTADSAVQSVKTGTSNGTISVDGTNVSVYGLGSAAYKTAGSASGNVPVTGAALGTTANVPVVTNTSGQLVPHASGTLGTAAFKATSAFDAAGAASTVQTNLDNYKTSNDAAVAAIKVTADGAVQSVTTGTGNGTIAVDGTDVSVKGLGSAAYKTAGSASGNVPVTGAALGTTANVPVVTNTSGALIPHASGALGTAAFKAYTDSSSASAISTGTSVPTERDIYYGLPTINGSHAYTSGTNIYTPTAVGSSGNVLQSSGSGAPSWVAQSSLSVGTAAKVGSSNVGSSAIPIYLNGGTPAVCGYDLSSMTSQITALQDTVSDLQSKLASLTALVETMQTKLNTLSNDTVYLTDSKGNTVTDDEGTGVVTIVSTVLDE